MAKPTDANQPAGFFSGGAHLTDERLGTLLSQMNRNLIFIGNYTDGTRPVLLPSWITAGFTGIPGAGEAMIYNTGDGTFNVWNGTGWNDMAGAGT